jgi:hypothetical protein
MALAIVSTSTVSSIMNLSFLSEEDYDHIEAEAGE